MQNVSVNYVGPGLSGRTASSRWVRDSINRASPLEQRADAVGMWMQWAGSIDGGLVTVQSINGGVAWLKTQTRMLEEADALIFVVDSQQPRLEANDEMRDEILAQFASTGAVPLVIQWNKRDHLTALPVADLSPRYNVWGAQEFETIATKGIGVLEAFRAALALARAT